MVVVKTREKMSGMHGRENASYVLLRGVARVSKCGISCRSVEKMPKCGATNTLQQILAQLLGIPRAPTPSALRFSARFAGGCGEFPFSFFETRDVSGTSFEIFCVPVLASPR